MRFFFFFQEVEGQFFGSINIFLLPAVWAVLSGKLPNCLFLGLQVYSKVGLTDISSIQFRSVHWPIKSSGGHEGWFSRDHLPVFLFGGGGGELLAVRVWVDMSTLWCCPSSISSAYHGVAHPQRCPERWFWRGFRGVWHAWTMRVSVSWQLKEEIPVDPQGSWSWSAPNSWSCALCRRYGEVSSSTCFRKPGYFFSESASRVHVSQP